MASKPKRLLLAAGGTGGHMFPAQALAEEMIKDGWETALITDARGEKLTSGFPNKTGLTINAASITPRRLVAGFGGYPAFPAVKVAQSLGLPTLLHEQNAVLGRVNRALSKNANILACGFDKLEKCSVPDKLIVTGNPLRSQIMNAVPDKYDAPTDKINILIVGGSLGARLISKAVPEAICSLPRDILDRLNVVQQTTSGEIMNARRAYNVYFVNAHCETFFHNIETELAKAHYVIARAGASSVSEIAAMGKPALFVPLAIAMDDHQTMNARSLKDLKAADILPESQFTPEQVAHILEKRFNDSLWLKQAAAAARKTAKPDAAPHLARLVKGLVQL